MGAYRGRSLQFFYGYQQGARFNAFSIKNKMKRVLCVKCWVLNVVFRDVFAFSRLFTHSK